MGLAKGRGASGQAQAIILGQIDRPALDSIRRSISTEIPKSDVPPESGPAVVRVTIAQTGEGDGSHEGKAAYAGADRAETAGGRSAASEGSDLDGVCRHVVGRYCAAGRCCELLWGY